MPSTRAQLVDWNGPPRNVSTTMGPTGLVGTCYGNANFAPNFGVTMEDTEATKVVDRAMFPTAPDSNNRTTTVFFSMLVYCAKTLKSMLHITTYEVGWGGVVVGG